MADLFEAIVRQAKCGDDGAAIRELFRLRPDGTDEPWSEEEDTTGLGAAPSNSDVVAPATAVPVETAHVAAAAPGAAAPTTLGSAPSVETVTVTALAGAPVNSIPPTPALSDPEFSRPLAACTGPGQPGGEKKRQFTGPDRPASEKKRRGGRKHK
ncbi:hypothetical protein AURDEDRAFT_122817 [Auricularia subglabra TFB-10046 SS5]|nr:hypothetical protein AURDEDRAFT_122817 [Auricularia subglabra TFB-10046 SS5]